jgi:hypothetical protein
VVSNQLGVAVERVCLAALPDGTALEAAGQDTNGEAVPQAEIYDPASNSLRLTGGAMNTARYGCTATTLKDGTVLIAGRIIAGVSIGTAEIYNPATGTFALTKGGMVNRRAFHQAMLLANGQVLIAGGVEDLMPLASAELYDPASGTFSATTGPLNVDRVDATSILLSDGRALIAGGTDGAGALDTAETYNPATSTFTFTANNMSIGRTLLSAAILPDGKVIVGTGSSVSAGQKADATCDEFDPSTNSFSPTGSLHIARIEAAAAMMPNGSPIFLGGTDNQGTEGGNYEPSGEIYNVASGTFRVTDGLNSLRVAYASALLHDGRVLLAGGNNAVTNVSSAEVFDPATGYFAPTANDMDTNRVTPNAVTLEDGKVLVANGSDGETADLFDPATMKFTTTAGAMVASRGAATATGLRDGTVLITGGLDLADYALNTAEIYNPATQTFSAVAATMTTPRAIHSAALLSDGRVLIAGGSSSDSSSDALNTAEIYDPARRSSWRPAIRCRRRGSTRPRACSGTAAVQSPAAPIQQAFRPRAPICSIPQLANLLPPPAS